MVLTQNGRGKAVVQSYESYQQQRYAMALLKRVVQGLADAAAGRTIPHEQVMAEVYALIDDIAAEKKAAAKAAKAATQAAPRAVKAAPVARRAVSDKYRVTWDPDARVDLQDIVRFIAEDSLSNARRVAARLNTRLTR